jgi:hypothetical protein
MKYGKLNWLRLWLLGTIHRPSMLTYFTGVARLILAVHEASDRALQRGNG